MSLQPRLNPLRPLNPITPSPTDPTTPPDPTNLTPDQIFAPEIDADATPFMQGLTPADAALKAFGIADVSIDALNPPSELTPSERVIYYANLTAQALLIASPPGPVTAFNRLRKNQSETNLWLWQSRFGVMFSSENEKLP